ncbi:MAG: DUF5916 domain-containing protein [Bacteroidales bacterium]|nr:DUF5916 domain-containing protein [Bacteroidales bacterium]
MILPLSAQQENLLPMDSVYKRQYQAFRLTGQPPVIDGLLNDSCWISEGNLSQPFVMQSPVERSVTTFPTRMKILYDDQYIYFAGWCYDEDPSKINRLIANRDTETGDLISIAFDTNHDLRTATQFGINAGGTKADKIHDGSTNGNLSWNAVWTGRSAITDFGWTAEFRIPFSQLRFSPDKTDKIWGLHVRRIIDRLQETHNWSLIPVNNPGLVYSFGEMQGIDKLPKRRPIEMLPYFSGKYTTSQAIPGSPYATGTKWNYNGGFDAKVGLSSDFTLDVTVNPDFGQIEADPPVMNLAATEVYYEEKRPFFLEGKHILDFALSNNELFYSRRIGNAPSYRPGNFGNFYSKTKDNVPIIDAVKLTGKDKNGLSVGILQSLTLKENAYITENGREYKKTAEPLTNYLAGRVQKDWNQGNTVLGGMITSVNRAIASGDTHLNILPDNAFTGGLDFIQYFNNRNYYMDFKGIFSYVEGSKEAMLALQQSPVHYFQRPDASSYLGVDDTRTNLSGTGGTFKIGRKGNHKLQFSESASWYSPGLELNDIGYLSRTDQIQNNLILSYSMTEPGKIFRNYLVSLYQNSSWTFNGTSTNNTIGWMGNGTFKNLWGVNAGISYSGYGLNLQALRGGPSITQTAHWNFSLGFNTDESKRISASVHYSDWLNTDGNGAFHTISPEVNLRIASNLQVNLDFSYMNNIDHLQYLYQINAGGEKKYLMGKLEQNSYTLTMKLNYNLTPNFSIQYYGSPFISAGKYTHLKKATNTVSKVFEERFHEFTQEEISFDAETNTYNVQEDGAAYQIRNPDFAFREFQSNLVARWEFKPGSTLYLVWSQSRSGGGYEGINDSYGNQLNNIFKIYPTNVLMVKFNYWFTL